LHEFLLAFHGFPDKAKYWSKTAIFYTSRAFDDPVWVEIPVKLFAMKYDTKKLEWCSYSYSKKRSRIRLFVLMQYTNVTNSQGGTDRHHTTA